MSFAKVLFGNTFYKPCKKQLNKSYFTYFMCAMYFGLILQYTCIRPSDVTCFCSRLKFTWISLQATRAGKALLNYYAKLERGCLKKTFIITRNWNEVV